MSDFFEKYTTKQKIDYLQKHKKSKKTLTGIIEDSANADSYVFNQRKDDYDEAELQLLMRNIELDLDNFSNNRDQVQFTYETTKQSIESKSLYPCIVEFIEENNQENKNINFSYLKLNKNTLLVKVKTPSGDKKIRFDY